MTPFAAYALAERIHASGVLAVVIAGLLLGHKAPLIQTAQSRLIERADWRTIAFLLENAVFLLIGLQASWLVSDVLRSELSLGRVLGLCGATLFAVVALRMAFLLAAHPVLARYGPAANRGVPIRYAVLAGWAGMRGVVTLAAAFVIPSDAPYREVLLVVALAVVAGTLFGQGLTLPWLARRLRVRGPDPAADALARAALLQQASSAGLARLREIEGDDPHGVGEVIRQRLDQRNFAAWELLSTRPGEETPSEVYARSRLEMIAAERAAVLRVRSSGDVPAEVVGEVLRMLDVEESTLDVATDRRARLTAVASVGGDARCPHLAEYAVVEVAPDVVCARCLDEGTRWVALRQCLVCGHVGCCDSSPRQHASGHYLQTRHPVMQSAEPGETWRWCYDDEVTG